jgi:pimeloyl-ACP methyl ester carboxylesterase
MNISSFDGTRISFDVVGTGRPILLLHGFSHDRTIWNRTGWVERLRSEFRVVTLDLRGCGESDKPSVADAYSVEAHIADVDAVLLELRIERPIVWGWSFGATVALHLAKSAMVSRTVAAGTYFGSIFTSAYVEARLTEATAAVQRARWSGLESWSAVEPNEVRGPLLVYSGTRDGNVVRELDRQRASIEAVGGHLTVLEGLNHIELLTATAPVAAVVGPFIRALA